MREYEYIIDKALNKGLTPARTILTNDEWLSGALGFRVGRHGLEGYRIKDDTPLDGVVDLDYSWPFPQWLSGERYNILVSRDSTVDLEDSVYSITDEYVSTHVFDVDVLTFGTGTLMQMADFGEYVVLVNGVVIIYYDPDLGGWTNMRSSATFPCMRAICNFMGQAVGGGVIGLWNPVTLTYDSWHDCDETYYIWSKIGSIDFTPDESNEAGYKRDPYGGDVYHTKRLGKNVIGYSSKGVTRIYPVTSPAATFGFDELSDIGPINRGAMDGNLHRHIYVGTDYIIREVTSEGIKELGYYYWMESLGDCDEDIIVSYDNQNNDFYIGTSTETYLLSQYGLTKLPQHPSAVWSIPSYDDEVVMLPVTQDTGWKPLLASGIFDFGYRGQKTIFSIESDALLTIEPTVTIGWANTLAVWGYTSAVQLNNEGLAAFVASGNDFIVQFTFTFVGAFSPITYVKVRYKMTDLRGIRGVYAPPIRGQGG